ncbi:MAG: dihydrofolate reductase [Acidiferrobacterales bacterium]|nr:dihydrofolate reductase [Acidiferrobacterales bacterium]
MNANRVIGKAGTTPWHYSADLKRFRQMTLGSTVVMGRKTWDSLPIKPLPERQNIVITRGNGIDETSCSSISQAIEIAHFEKIWVIGGAEIYALAVEHCDRMDITFVPDTVDEPDCTYFPPIDWSRWSAGPRIQFDDDDRLFRQQFTVI